METKASTDDRAPSLEELTAKWRAVARYGITKHAVAGDGYSRINTTLTEHTGLPWDEVNKICKQLNIEAHIAAGSPASNWGVTQYHPELETPPPSRFTPEVQSGDAEQK